MSFIIQYLSHCLYGFIVFCKAWRYYFTLVLFLLLLWFGNPKPKPRGIHRKLIDVTETPGPFFRNRKKPQWVIDTILELAAHYPKLGCRKLAALFNHLYHSTHNITVSKSWVYNKLIQYGYQLQVIKRGIKNRKPLYFPFQHTWGVDLTTVTDEQNQQHLCLAAIEHFSRKAVCMSRLPNKRSISILIKLLQAMQRYGMPESIKTDNDKCFNSILFKQVCRKFGIRHRTSRPGRPWENGRVERFFKTFKEKIRQVAIQDASYLDAAIPEYLLWYNHVHPHNNLHGSTPDKVWNNQVANRRNQCYDFRTWEGVLTGLYIPPD